MRTVYIDDSTQGVKLGFRQEHDYTEIVYTLPSDWNGVVEAFIKKPGATASVPLTGVTQTDGTVSLTLTRTDLIEAGRGALEYMCTMDGIVAKSKVFPVIIAADVISESTDRPDEWQSWIDELTQLAAQVRTDALGAAASATSASGSATDASQSASGAAQSAQSASESADSAERSAQSASDSASDAEEAKNTILNMTATATTLPEGSSATVDYNNGVMAFGIPRGDTGAKGDKGDTGETGATPQMSIGTVETLAPDEDATATITGTAENPVLNLGLPKGETGEVSLLELIANTKVDEKTDSVPYQRRSLSGVGSHESLRKIVGGTVGWNQLVQNGDFADSTGWSKGGGVTSFSVANGTATLNIASGATYNKYLGRTNMPIISEHKYLISAVMASPSITQAFIQRSSNGMINASGNKTISANDTLVAGVYAETRTGTASFYFRFSDTATSADTTATIKKAQIIDLTAMFGATIADYIYNLEQSSAGAGVAWFKRLFPNDYYPYNAGELKSIQTSAHKTYDADGNVIGTYPLDSSITLMGIPKLDASNNLYYDGDEYAPDGTVNSRYGIVDLGTLTWVYVSNGDYFYAVLSDKAKGFNNVICDIYATAKRAGVSNLQNNQIVGGMNDAAVYVKDSRYTDPTTFKSAMNDVYLVYELATPTTETASPYTELQAIESGGTEEFVGAEIPVGHESVYPRTLADTMPTQDGSYKLALTVSGGKPSVEWEVSR